MFTKEFKLCKFRPPTNMNSYPRQPLVQQRALSGSQFPPPSRKMVVGKSATCVDKPIFTSRYKRYLPFSQGPMDTVASTNEGDESVQVPLNYMYLHELLPWTTTDTKSPTEGAVRQSVSHTLQENGCRKIWNPPV